MEVRQYLQRYNKSFQEISSTSDKYSVIYNEILKSNWLVPIEEKLSRLNDDDRIHFERIISILKSKNDFTKEDIDSLGVFISKVNSISKVADRINNFKHNTALENGTDLELDNLFNYVKSITRLADFNYELNKNLYSFVPHLFSVIKNCQDPLNYPLFYKFWKQISKEVLDLEDSYDAMCDMYKTFPVDNRSIQFSSYFHTIADALVSGLEDEMFLDRATLAKFLKDKVLNLDPFNSQLDIYIPLKVGSLISDRLSNLLVKLSHRILPYFEVLDYLVEELELERGSEKFYFHYKNTALIFNIGSLYVWNVNTKHYEYLSIKAEGDITKDYKSTRKGEEVFNNKVAEIKSVNVLKQDILEAAQLELDITKSSSRVEANKADFEELVFNKEYRDEVFTKLGIIGNQDKKEIGLLDTKNMKHPLNQILYGPPGTGKTYTLQNKFFDYFTVNKVTITEEQYISNVIQDLSWWQVITLVLLDIKNGKVGDIYAHKYIKVKEQFGKSKTVVPTIWGQLQAHTLKKCPNVNVEKRQEPLYFWKDESSNWSIIQEDLEASYNEILEIFENLKNYIPETNKTVTNYEFVTFHQSFTYEDFIEGIKPDLEDNLGGNIKYKIKNGVFKTLCSKARKDPANKYAIFIDEINRGNVSAIFGELITLIEESKRLGNEEALEVTLPYSKEKFGVPNNLHIIGTMNTADRSVEALDTALRRRFTFEEMMPQSHLLCPELQLYNAMWKWEGYSWESKEWQKVEKGLDEVYGFTDRWNKEKGELWDRYKKERYNLMHIEELTGLIEKRLDLEKILKTINDRIEVLLDRDHLIGHSYFLNVDSLETLQSRFMNNIIPLLQEYFYGDYGKIGLVLGEGFVKQSKDEKVTFAKFTYDGDQEFYSEKIVYTLENKWKEGEFKQAIDNLLGKKSNK